MRNRLLRRSNRPTSRRPPLAEGAGAGWASGGACLAAFLGVGFCVPPCVNRPPVPVPGGCPVVPLFVSADVLPAVAAPIFHAELCVVTLGTLRIIFVAKGRKALAPLLGFFEISLWLF